MHVQFYNFFHQWYIPVYRYRIKCGISITRRWLDDESMRLKLVGVEHLAQNIRLARDFRRAAKEFCDMGTQQQDLSALKCVPWAVGFGVDVSSTMVQSCLRCGCTAVTTACCGRHCGALAVRMFAEGIGLCRYCRVDESNRHRIIRCKRQRRETVCA